jgi:hypothetical protein
MLREVIIVLLPGEAFFFGGGDKLSVSEESSGRVVEITRNSKDIRQNCLLANTMGSPSADFRGCHPFRLSFFIARGSLLHRTAKAKGQSTTK